ncbi:hypothetical protein VTL71DRAFT_10125 [Oculimacula yallundae]|uniref:Major facilitator superfamily (MFS) profile domain-containing protein n=1 Tax=Oculimacula yallundae TaxID=86028 RepID=A0ABR4BQM9_9HELO
MDNFSSERKNGWDVNVLPRIEMTSFSSMFKDDYVYKGQRWSFAPSGHFELPKTPGDKERVANVVTQDEEPVTWDGAEDPENPQNWGKPQRWLITISISLFAFISTLSSTIVEPALPDISHDLHITDSAVSQLIFSIFGLGYAFGPLLIAPLSELLGKTWVLQGANLVYLIFNTVSISATTSVHLVVCRFLAGLGGSASLTVGGAILGDMWRPEERGAAVAVFSLMPLAGPVVGPITGAVITAQLSWHWIFLVTSGADVVVAFVGLFIIRETSAVRLLAAKAKRIRPLTWARSQSLSQSWQKTFLTAISRPFRMLFTQPLALVLGICQAYLYGLVYLTLSTFSTVWRERYHQSTITASLNYLSLLLGSLLGTQVTVLLLDRFYRRLKERNGGVGKAEFRLPLILLGSLLAPFGLFLFGWSAQYTLNWILPNLGGLLFAFGNTMTYQAIQTFLIDEYVQFAASALALSLLLRSLTGFLFPLFAPQMFTALGVGWGNSVLGFVAVAIGIPMPVLLWRYSEKLRRPFLV